MVIRGGRELAAKAPLFYASRKCGFGCTNRELPIKFDKSGPGGHCLSVTIRAWNVHIGEPDWFQPR